MAWRAMPRCNNMSLRRTKSKVAMTLARHFRNTDAYLSRGFLPSPHAGLALHRVSLDSQGKTAFRLCPCPIPESLNSRLFSPLHTLWLTSPERSYCRISGQMAPLTIKEAIVFDPVTKADRDAETAIREGLAQAYPSHGILGEEFGATATDAEYCWIIDPIDGTRAFILGLPLWGTLIGLTRAGSPLLGLMDQPFTRERFWSGETESFFGHDGVDQNHAHASLRRAWPGAACHHQHGLLHHRGGASAVWRLEPRRASAALRRRLLQLLPAGDGPHRPRRRGGPEAVRHSAPDPDHRAGRRHRHLLGGRRPTRGRPHRRRRRQARRTRPP